MAIGNLHVAAICLAGAASWAAGGEAMEPFTRLFDTGTSFEEAPSERELTKRPGWAQVPEGKLDHKFAGDAVAANDKLLVVFRTRRRGIEVYSQTPSGPKLRASLSHSEGGSGVLGGPTGVKVLENSPSSVMVEASCLAERFAHLRFRLTAGEGILEVRPGEGAKALHVATRARYLVVPDFFAEDMVFGLRPFADIALPAENFFLSLIEGGDAILMCVWQSGHQKATASVAGLGSGSHLCSSRVDFVPGKSIWLAFLEGAPLWHGGEKIDSLTWQPPFPARWRCTLGRKVPYASSWDLAKGPEGNDIHGRIDGPFLIYPIDRRPATPLTVYCPTDILRNTLGVGPCQYILATEGLASEANPTPDQVMAWVEKEFKRKKLKVSADEITERLKQMTEHVGRVRVRIAQYGELAREVLKLCREDKSLREFSGAVALKADYLQTLAEKGLEKAGPPARLETLAGEVAALVGKENALAGCERLAGEVRAIGAAHDQTLSRCRMQTRWLRQSVAMLAAQDPRVADLARQVQALADRVLAIK